MACSFNTGNNTGFALATMAVDVCHEGYYRFPANMVVKSREMFETLSGRILSAYQDSAYEVPLFVIVTLMSLKCFETP